MTKSCKCGGETFVERTEGDETYTFCSDCDRVHND